MTDEEFMTKILSEIANYAKDNGMRPDDTIRTIADNMLFLLGIATFNSWGRDTHD